MTMEILNLDLNWEEYGLPKAKESKDYNLPRYIKGSGRKPSSRARRRQQTKKHKKKNIRIAKAKGYDLEKCSACEKNGNVSVLSDRYSNRNHDSIRGTWLFEGKKKTVALSKEIKNYPNDILTFEDEYLYPLKRNYFNPLFGEVSYCCSDTKKGITDNIFCLPENASTPVKEVLFDCLLNS